MTRTEAIFRPKRATHNAGISASNSLHTRYRVDSGRGQDRTLRGIVSVECAIDGWFRDGEEIGEIADGILSHPLADSAAQTG